MVYTTHLPCIYGFKKTSEYIHTEIVFHDGFLEKFTLAMSLLWHGLADKIVLLSQEPIRKVTIVCNSKISTAPRAAIQADSESLHVELSKQELGYWLHFFLRYYRDGAAEVDHIDVEYTEANASLSEAWLILKFPNAKPPVSAEEACRRLGL